MKREVTGNRRTFLKSAAFFSGFAALLTLGKQTVSAPNQPLPKGSPSGQGYRLTEQIKRYYEAARF